MAGYYTELVGGEATASAVYEALWSPKGNRRPKVDAVVVRGAFTPKHASVLDRQHQRQARTFAKTLRYERGGLRNVVRTVREINRLLGLDPEQICCAAGGDIVEGHVDFDRREDRFARGIVASACVNGFGMFGLSVMQPEWERVDATGEVFNRSTGSYVAASQMRTLIAHYPGDVVYIPPGIVHAVECGQNRRSILTAQNPSTGELK